MCNTERPQLTIEFVVLDNRLRGWGFPKWGSNWAAGLDLFACINEPLEVRPQEAPTLVSTGMAFRIGDPSWCALVLPRSGLGHRKGLVLGNLVGLVDADFDGPCEVSLWNRSRPTDSQSSSIIVQPGDRIAQLVFTKTIRPTMLEVESFSNRSERGDRGYGSTGD